VRCLLVLAGLTSAAHAQTFSVLYNFGSNSGDPRDPQFEGIVAQGRDGNLYSSAPEFAHSKVVAGSLHL
jgi:hypothetical protein